MERAGLNFDIPGMKVADPTEVAREGLDQLPFGPVYIAGGNGEDVARRSDPDRAKVVEGTNRFMRRLLDGDGVDQDGVDQDGLVQEERQ